MFLESVYAIGMKLWTIVCVCVLSTHVISRPHRPQGDAAKSNESWNAVVFHHIMMTVISWHGHRTPTTHHANVYNNTHESWRMDVEKVAINRPWQSNNVLGNRDTVLYTHHANVPHSWHRTHSSITQFNFIIFTCDANKMFAIRQSLCLLLPTYSYVHTYRT